MYCLHIIFYVTVLWSMSVLCQDSFDPYADPAAGGTGNNNNRDRNQYGNSNNNDPYNRDRNQSQYDRDRYGNNNDRDRDRDRYGSNNDRDRDRYGSNDNRDYNNRDRNQYGNDQYGRSNQSGGQYGTGGTSGGYNSQDNRNYNYNRDRNQYGSQDYNNRDRSQNDRDRNQYDRNDDRNYGGGSKFMDDGNCCEEYCYGIDEDPYLRFGDKTAYQFVYGKGSNQHIVPQCKPIQFWAMIRDGAKFPDRMTIQRLRQMNRIHDDIVRNYEDKRSYPDKGKLCQEDYEPLKRWRWNDTISDHNENGLTAQGTEDLKFIARRYQTRLRDLLSTSYSEGQYYFQYTSDGERTVDSYKAFLEGLLANDAFRVHANVKNAVDRNNPYSQCDNNQYNSQSGQDRYNSQSNSPYGGSNSNNYGSNYGSPSSSSSPYGSNSNSNSQYGSNSNSQYGSSSNSQYGSNNANNYNSGSSGSNYNDNNVYNSNSNTGNTGNTNYNSNSGGYGGGVGGSGGFGDNSQGFVEYRKFTEKQEYREMVKNVFRRLGFRYSLNETVILDMYDLCRYEKAWNVNRPSPWCAVFTKDQLKLLEYGEDLKSYYNDGYGNFQNKKKGCLPLKDLHDRFERTVNNGYASEQKAAFQFTDAATLKLLLVSMGIAEDHSTLTADNYYQQRTRTWRTAELTPYGGNLAAILYQCEQGEKFRVMLFLNEKPVEYPGCSVGLCNWNTFKNKIDRSVRECDFCGNGSSSLSTGGAFLTISLVVAIVLSIFSRV